MGERELEMEREKARKRVREREREREASLSLWSEEECPLNFFVVGSIYTTSVPHHSSGPRPHCDHESSTHGKVSPSHTNHSQDSGHPLQIYSDNQEHGQ